MARGQTVRPVKGAGLSHEDTLEHLEVVIARLERLGDRLEAYADDQDERKAPRDAPRPPA